MRRLVLALIFILVLPSARAITPIALRESFAGTVNFTGTHRTIRTSSNEVDPCRVSGQNTSVSTTLTGIPSGATVLRAHLYWAGSGTSPDYSVQMDGTTVNADASRRHTLTASNTSYFAGAADVTAKVAAKGNGTYSFRRLTVDSTSYCAVEGVVGGFALLVVYSHSSEPFRVLNVYEGFEPIHYSSVSLTLSNFRIPNPIGSATGRVGHITWEGDATLGNTNAEDLFFNGVELFDTNSPRHNQFNSASNINNSTTSYGIDFDAYTVGEPIIQPGQTSATTKYQSGQDLVLLQSEVIAVPNVPVADVSVAMTAANPVMTQGITNSYTVTVTNNGPNTETGPIVVNDSIPPELTINSASGTGWNCTVSGQAVTCSYAGALSSGVSLAPITISVTPNVVAGSITNTVTVAGQSFDNVLDNNSATVVSGAQAGDYVFTDSKCAAGIDFSSNAQPCNVYSFGTRTAGTPLTNIFITPLDSAGRPMKLHNSQDRTINFYFGMMCINPAATAGIAPSFTAQASMPNCIPNGTKTWTTPGTGVLFRGGEASSAVGYSLNYNDVGMVEFYMVDSQSRTGSSGAFVFKPAQIALSGIASGGVTNPAAADANGAKFIRAGDLFSMTITALTSGGVKAPNFGKEGETFRIGVSAAIDPATGAPFADMSNLPSLPMAFGSIIEGAASGSAFSWSEAGILRLTPGITSQNYLGRGDVSGTPVNVGRFVPHHFDTVVDEPMGSCAAAMNCPPGVGAAYSGQPFEVEITARNSAGQAVQNYRGKFARTTTLTAWDKPGLGPAPPAAVNNPPVLASGSNSLSNGTAAPASFIAGTATLTNVAYNFAHQFSSTAPRATNFVAPTTIHIRAVDTDGVSSDQASAATVEGAVRIVTGRLLVQNAYGSELLRLPVPLMAQYWSGDSDTGRWLNSVADDTSAITPAFEFGNCTLGLAGCALSAVSAAPFTLVDGGGVVRLNAPGAGKAGGADMKVNGPPWLPSTWGRLRFGARKAPIDYIREVY